MRKVLALAVPLLLATVALLMVAPVCAMEPPDDFAPLSVEPGTGMDRNGNGIIWRKVMMVGNPEDPKRLTVDIDDVV